MCFLKLKAGPWTVYRHKEDDLTCDSSHQTSAAIY